MCGEAVRALGGTFLFGIGFCRRASGNDRLKTAIQHDATKCDNFSTETTSYHMCFAYNKIYDLTAFRYRRKTCIVYLAQRFSGSPTVVAEYRIIPETV